MNEEDSQNRFSALVSGTVAEHIGPGLLQRHKQDSIVSARPMSPAILVRQNQRSLPLQMGHTQDESAVYRIDPVRRFRGNDAQGAIISSSKLLTRTPGNNGSENEEEQGTWQYDPHIFSDLAHNAPAARNSRTTPSGIPMITHSSGPKLISRGNGGLLRPTKSLRQRFDVTGGHDMPSSDPIVPIEVPNVSSYPPGKPEEERPSDHLQAHRQDSQPKGHSRDESVVSSIFGRQVGQDEDISSIMMRGATDLRNAKYEIEEQRREITYMQSQLETLRNEKEEILHRLKAVKEVAKKGLESNSRSLESMRVALDRLKAQSEESFVFTAQVKTSLPNVQDLRLTAEEAIKSIEPLLNDDGHFYKTEETRRIINELHLDHNQAQQVVDLLRERLQSVGAELIDAKARVTELESSQVADREALRSSSASLSSASEQVKSFAESLKKQQVDLSEALSTSANLEARLAIATEQVSKLKEIVSQKNEELESLSGISQENTGLKSALDARNARIQELEGVQDKLSSATAVSNEQLSRISVLEASIFLKDQMILAHVAKIVEKEASLENSSAEIQGVKQALGASEARENALLSDISRTKDEVEEFKNKLQEIEKALEEARQEIALHIENLHKADTQYKVLEERFEDQSVTLRLTKEAHGDMQERLVESEAKFARDLEATTGKLTCEIAVMAEQRSTLQAKINDLEDTARLQDQVAVAMKAEHDAKLQEQEEALQSQLASELRRADDAHRALEEARAALKDLEVQLSSGKEEVTVLKEELREAKLPSSAHREAVDTLNAQIMALRSETTDLTLRARNIDARYRTGDLNEEEKTFISTLIRTSQNIHEQELVAKGNELRRRDNTIKDQEARIKLLENTLAKHLDTQAQVNAVSGTENRSLIDPSAWVRSSDTTSSPLRPLDEDLLSTNVDNTVSAKPTPAPRMPPRPPLAPVSMPPPNVMLRTPGPARLRPTPAGGKGTPASYKNSPVPLHKVTYVPDRSSPLVPPKTPASDRSSAPKPGFARRGEKTMFSRIATDCSDDIQDFDDRSRKPSPISSASPSDRPLAKTTGLGKRTKPSDVASPTGSQQYGRHAKRPRTRSRADMHGDSPPAGSLKPQALQKTRTRKRR